MSVHGSLGVIAAIALAATACEPTVKPFPAPPKPEICSNGLDDNQDGKTDCADPGCFKHASCLLSAPEDCTNGIDDNQDGKTDCADLDCAASPSCIESACADNLDNDGDGKTDCADADCSAASNCNVTTEAGKCNDGLDNDNDNLTDCQDVGDCTGASCGTGCACGGGAKKEVACGDGVDNDGDTRTDCADMDCVGAGTEICTDGVDNTCDGAIDCGDAKCAAQCTNQTDGEACTADNQCAGGKCLTEVSTGHPNGSCSNMASCNVSAQTGCNGGICITGTGFNICRKRCTGTGMGATGRCRVGYACLDSDLNASNSNNYCVALCASDSDCSGSGANYGCNPWSKLCQNKDSGKAKYGAPCISGAQCESSRCTSSYPGGYCFGLCSGTAKSCGGDGVCYYYASYGDNAGECWDGCTMTSQCRGSPYTCQNKGQGTVCYCGVFDDPCTSDAQCCSGICNFFFLLCD